MPDGFKSIKDVFNSDPALKKIRAVINENDVVNDFEKIFPEFTKVAKAKSVQHKTTYTKGRKRCLAQRIKV